MTIKNITAFLMSAAMLISSGCGAQDDLAEALENDDMELKAKTFTASDEYVKEIGRTYYDENNILWIVHSAGGIEFSFTGTDASAVLAGDSNAGTAWGKDNLARYAVYVDGVRTAEGMMDEAEKTVEIISGCPEKETNVKILKLSECANSTLGIKSLNVTSRGDIAPAAQKPLKIEFVGDSITCGYGVDDEVREHHFKTDTEDATRAYAVKTAELLDADYSLVSMSGHGIISGYSSDGELHADQALPQYYSKLGRSYGGRCGSVLTSDIEWDFSRFVPDVVVVNLGTNDDSYTGGDEAKQQAFKDAYVEFIGDIREKNPDADILCTLGIMGDRLYPYVEAAVSEYSEKTGDSRVYSMKFDVQDPADGYAADWHPTAATHEKAADKLAEKIREILG